MMAGLCDVAARDPKADEPARIKPIFKKLRELTWIMETAMHEAVLSCARARRQMLEGIATARPTIH